MIKAHLSAFLPLKAEEKRQALYTWVYPVHRHIGVLFFPTQHVIRKANMAMRIAPGIRSWALPTTYWKLPHNRGVCARIRGRLYAAVPLSGLCQGVESIGRGRGDDGHARIWGWGASKSSQAPA